MRGVGWIRADPVRDPVPAKAGSDDLRNRADRGGKEQAAGDERADERDGQRLQAVDGKRHFVSP